MLGEEQETWFADVATSHDAVWTTVVQQVVVHEWRFTPGNVVWTLAQWDGYSGARRRFPATLAEAPAPVVPIRDVHSSSVWDLSRDFAGDGSPPVVTASSSTGTPSDTL